MARTRATITCETCHAVVPRLSDTDTLRVRFCSRQCASKRPADRVCSRCHIAPSVKAWGKHCRDCRADVESRAAHNHRKSVRMRLEVLYKRLAGATCGECCERFIPNRTHQRFCNADCARRFHARRHSRMQRLSDPAARRERLGPADAACSIEAIGRRDGWRCHICSGRVRRSDATRDHLIPFADGGTWDPVNLALAHRSCNSKRGAGRIAAQLRLVA